MFKRITKQTDRDRFKCRKFDSQTRLPNDGFPMHNNCPQTQPRLQRILGFSKGNIDAASEEITELDNVGQKHRTHTIKKLVLILKTHLPYASQELQKLRKDHEISQGKITQYEQEFTKMNDVNITIRAKLRRLAEENGKLVQELSVMKNTKSRRNVIFETTQGNPDEMRACFESIQYENSLMKKHLSYKEHENANLNESCTKLRMEVFQLRQEKKDLKETQNRVRTLEKNENEKYVRFQSNFVESLEKIKVAEEKIEMQASEISRLKSEYDRNEQLKKQNNELYQTICHCIRENKTIQEQLDKKHEENLTLIQTTKTQMAEMSLCKANHVAQLEKLQRSLEKISDEKNKLQERNTLLTQNETKHIEPIHSSLNKRYNELKIELDNSIHENFKQSEELSLLKEINTMQSAKNKSLQGLIEEKEQEITTLQTNMAIQNKKQKQDITKLFQEKQKLKTDLEQEKKKTNQLETAHKTLQDALEDEKQKAHVKEEEYKRNLFENQQIKETRTSEREKFREAILIQQQLRDENHKLQQKINEMNEVIRKLNDTISQGQEHLKRSEKERDLTNLALHKVKEKQLEEKAKLEDTCKNQQQLNEENLQLRNKADEQLYEILKFQKDLEHTEDIRRKQEEHVSMLKEQIQKLLNEVDQLRNEKNIVSQELILEKGKTTTIEGKHPNQFKELQETQHHQIKSLQAAMETQNIALKQQQQSQELLQEKNALQEILSEIKANAQKKEEECRIITIELQEMQRTQENEIISLKKEFNDQQQALRIETRTAKEEIQQLLREKEEIDNELHQVKVNAKKQDRETYETKRMLKAAEDFQLTINAENEELKHQVNVLRCENKNMGVELLQVRKNAVKQEEDAKSHFSHEIQILRKEVDRIKIERDKMLEENASLQKENSKQNSSFQQKIETQKNEIISLKKEFNDQQQALRIETRTAKEEIQQLLREKEELDNELHQVKVNAKKQDRETYETKRMLKAAEDFQLTINAENEELKHQVNILRCENKNMGVELLQVRENAFKQEEDAKSNFSHEIQILRKEVDRIKIERDKMLEENASLQKENSKHNSSFQQKIETQKNEIAKLRSANRMLQEDAQRKATNSKFVERHVADRELQQQLESIKDQLKNAQQELDETKSRLSRAMGDKLTDNNPNIADLSDRNRPTKLSERYQELYDNQWTDAFEVVHGIIKSEENTIAKLMDILMETMSFCKAESIDQMTTITETLSKGKELPASVVKQLKDLRKLSAESYGKGLYTDFLKSLNKSKFTNSEIALKVPKFLQECLEICWLMTVQDPPLVLGPEIRRDAPFNKEHFRAYTKSGNRIDYVVWPVLLLHQDGPVLCKGVAQGY